MGGFPSRIFGKALTTRQLHQTMVDPSSHEDDIWIIVSRLLSVAATGFFIVFASSIVVDLFPLQLLSPQWQVLFIARVLAAGSFALVGFCLVHIAAALSPANLALRAHLKSLRKLAIAATLGFLLLIPLQGFATWRGFRIAKTNQATQINTAKRRLAPLKAAVSTSTTTAELQARLAQIQDFRITLTPDDLKRPLPELKEGIRASMDRAENLYFARISGPTPAQIWAAAQSAVKTVIASIGFALAFSAGAQGANASETLLDTFTSRWGQKAGRRRRRRQPLPFPTPTEE